MRIRPLAAEIAAVLAAGCSSAPGAGHQHRGGSGSARYWSRCRIAGARPVHGLGYRQGTQTNAHPTLLALRVGALFFRNDSANHYCTASVIASLGRDLLIRAAHCIITGKGGEVSSGSGLRGR